MPLWDTLRTRRVPLVTYALIALNVVVFLCESALAGAQRGLVAAHGFVPARMSSAPLAEVDNILSSMFMHAPESWLHLGGNMLFLWVFGDDIEDALGRGRFLAFYVLSGCLAAVAQWLVEPSSMVPMVGASGAISGVLAAYISLYPATAVKVLNPIPIFWMFGSIVLTVPAWLIVALFMAANLLSATALNSASAGIAFYAHIGGFLAGLLLVRVMLPGPSQQRSPGLVSTPR